MEMNQKDIEQLIDRYLRGECTEDEARMVNSYFNRAVAEVPQAEPVKDMSKHKRRVWKNITSDSSGNTVRIVFKYLSMAAAIVLVFCGWWFIDFPPSKDVNGLVQQEDIAPGTYGATLVLTDGRTITLDSARQGAIVSQSLTYDDGTPILGEDGLSLTEVADITATTAKGQLYTFTLPDGTKVWLNADSRLTFPLRFASSERRVSLEGEGYFEVREQRLGNQDGHGRKVSFIVSTDGQDVEVIGTKFNIIAYPDEKTTKTTLVEGTVKVNGQLLVPGQQSTLTSDGAIRVEDADIDQVLAWQQGDFVFRGETLEEVLRSVARWYNVEVRYEREEAKSITVGGIVSRSRNIRAVLRLMESTGKVRFKVSDNVITVR